MVNIHNPHVIHFRVILILLYARIVGEYKSYYTSLSDKVGIEPTDRGYLYGRLANDFTLPIDDLSLSYLILYIYIYRPKWLGY